MLRRYKDFIFESLINESIVVFSDKFKKILGFVDSPVAKALLDIESKDLDIANNYLDTNDKDTISFITDRKVKEIEQSIEKFVVYKGEGGFLKHSPANAEMFKMLEYTPKGESCYHPEDGEIGEVLKSAKSTESDKVYLKVQFEDGISIVNKDKTRKQDIKDLAFIQNRQTIRTGRGVKALLSKSEYAFKDAEIEQFVNKYKSEWDKMNDIFRKFELVSGNSIATWYNYTKYQNHGQGTLGNSCMKSSPSSFFDIYCNNPDKCKLLILKSDDETKIKGRAIIWHLDSPKNIIYMDRIYTNTDSDVELFKQYALKNGWYHKRINNSSDDTSMIGNDGTKTPESISVNLLSENSGQYGNYPYLDTLKYFYYLTGVLTTKHPNKDKSVYILEDTGGRYINDECEVCDGEGRVDCPECDGSGQVNCSECYSRSKRRSTGTIECEDCDGKGETECVKCKGSGEVDGEECKDCDGNGNISCDTCDGNGETDCTNCGGDGEHECSNCEGSGRVDCPECQ